MNEICDKLPSTPQALSKIKGIGKVKMEMFSDELLDIIIDYREENNIEDEIPEEPEIPIKVAKKKNKVDTKKASFDLFKSGKTVAEIAEERGFVVSTIEGHLAHYVGIGELDIKLLIADDKMRSISDYMLENSSSTITEIKIGLKNEFTYSELKLVFQYLLSQNKIEPAPKEHT
jgi:uncharacterized protein YpbB